MNEEINVSEEIINRLGKLTTKQMELEDKIKARNEETATLQKELNKISMFNIPDLMDEAGIQSFRLTSGAVVSVNRGIKASISNTNAEAKAEAFKWLRDNGFEDIIKNEVFASFKKGEDEVAKKLKAELETRGLVVKHKESVHGNTLSAFIKGQLSNGQSVPMEILGAYEYCITKIKRQ